MSAPQERDGLFFTVLDNQAAGKNLDYTPATIEGGLLQKAAQTALQGIGIERPDVILLNSEPIAFGSTSTVYVISANTPASRAPAEYAMRVQPPGKKDGYTIAAETLARHQAFAAGVRTPKIHASQMDIPQPDRPDFTFTIEDLVIGQNGLDHPEAGSPYPVFDTQAAQKEGRLVGRHRSYRNHITAGLESVLTITRNNNMLTSTEAEALYTYFDKAALINKLGAQASVLLHGDPAPYNVLVPTTSKGADNTLPYLIDFSESRAGPPLHDLAYVTFSYARRNADYQLDRLLDSYTAAGGHLPGDIIEESITAIRLQHLILNAAASATYIQQRSCNPDIAGVEANLTIIIKAIRQDAATLSIFDG